MSQLPDIFRVTIERGLMQLGEESVSVTPDGLEALDELLFYLTNHPRADIAKRAARLREAVHESARTEPA